MFRRRETATIEDPPEREPTTSRLELPRRILDVPVVPSGPGSNAHAVGRVTIGGDFGPTLWGDHPWNGRADAQRHLAVGQGIRLVGEIVGCARLTIDGEVHAALEAAEHLVIHEGGRFEGSGEVETADIAGVFDGTLSVRGRLLIRATGRVHGDIRFGELEIERGGEVGGKIDAQPRAPHLTPVRAAAGGD